MVNRQLYSLVIPRLFKHITLTPNRCKIPDSLKGVYSALKVYSHKLDKGNLPLDIIIDHFIVNRDRIKELELDACFSAGDYRVIAAVVPTPITTLTLGKKTMRIIDLNTLQKISTTCCQITTLNIKVSLLLFLLFLL